MQDTVEITLPSGAKAEIRNYTTRNDDEKAEQLMYIGVNTETTAFGKGLKQEKLSVKLPMANILAGKRAYIPRLVVSLNGDSSNIAIRLGELRSEDYEAIAAKVEEIVDEHSPKVKADKSAKTTNSNKK